MVEFPCKLSDLAQAGVKLSTNFRGILAHVRNLSKLQIKSDSPDADFRRNGNINPLGDANHVVRPDHG